LRACGREHSADDSRRTLRLLAERDLNYSFDLLFGLPNQSLHDLRRDLEELSEFSPPHVSLYNLTVPHGHKMNVGRAPDETQAEMFEMIERSLLRDGILRYEVSNFARPGFESRHNRLYWTGGTYWGVGISAHSYFPARGDRGVRCWNSPHLKTWIAQTEIVQDFEGFWRHLPPKQVEFLAAHEALTDFFHTRLRQIVGFSQTALKTQIDGLRLSSASESQLWAEIDKRFKKLLNRGLLTRTGDCLAMSRAALPIANSVFLELTFDEADLAKFPQT
jgi:oxygen-independent coproporphyrinogen-3 oxidase